MAKYTPATFIASKIQGIREVQSLPEAVGWSFIRRSRSAVPTAPPQATTRIATANFLLLSVTWGWERIAASKLVDEQERPGHPGEYID